MSNPTKLAILLLRIGLAITFLYASVSSLLWPEAWLWYIPVWLQNLLPSQIQLTVHAIFELTLAIWLLTGWKTFYPALLYALDLLIIILLNISAMDVIFRDFGLLFAAGSLAILSKPRAKQL